MCLCTAVSSLSLPNPKRKQNVVFLPCVFPNTSNIALVPQNSPLYVAMHNVWAYRHSTASAAYAMPIGRTALKRSKHNTACGLEVQTTVPNWSRWYFSLTDLFLVPDTYICQQIRLSTTLHIELACLPPAKENARFIIHFAIGRSHCGM